MEKQLEVGKNYNSIFGLKENQGMIYLGENRWKMVCPVNGEKEVESEQTTKSALAYINQPTVHVGRM